MPYPVTIPAVRVYVADIVDVPSWHRDCFLLRQKAMIGKGNKDMAAQLPIEIKAARKELAKALDLLREAFTNTYIANGLAQGLVIERQKKRIEKALTLVTTHLLDREQDSLWIARQVMGDTPST